MQEGTKLDLEVSSLYFLFKGKSHKTDHLSNKRPISYEKNIRPPEFTAYLKSKLLSEIHLSFEVKRQRPTQVKLRQPRGVRQGTGNTR